KETYRKAIERTPDAAGARALLANMLLADGNRDEAVSLMQQGIARTPEVPRLHLDLASVLERSGRIQEAAAEYAQYPRLAPIAPDSQTMAELAKSLDQQASL